MVNTGSSRKLLFATPTRPRQCYEASTSSTAVCALRHRLRRTGHTGASRVRCEPQPRSGAEQRPDVQVAGAPLPQELVAETGHVALRAVVHCFQDSRQRSMPDVGGELGGTTLWAAGRPRCASMCIQRRRGWPRPSKRGATQSTTAGLLVGGTGSEVMPAQPSA